MPDSQLGARAATPSDHVPRPGLDGKIQEVTTKDKGNAIMICNP
jgi:hypothetical protein